MSEEPFVSQRDPRLGALLREHFEAPDHDLFVARAMAGLDGPVTLWDDLARWARPGIAAAMLLATALGYWAMIRASDATAPQVVAEMPALETLDSDGLMGVALGSTR